MVKQRYAYLVCILVIRPFEQRLRALVQAIERSKSPLFPQISKAFVLALCVLAPFDAWKADEAVIRGHVHGMERTHGVWVGLDTRKRALSHYQHAPFDDTFVEQERNEVEDWLFAPDGEFELRSAIKENANLIVISKNRVPILIPIAPDANVQTLQIDLSLGMELEGIVHDNSGVPISGATVSIRPSGEGFEIPSFAIPQWSTGADGSFQAAGLEPREYLLIVSASDYAPIIVPYFVIPNVEVRRLEIRLVKGHYVSGKVIDENGVPVPDVLVRSSWTRSHAKVLESDGVMKVGKQNRFGWYFPQTQTSEDGTFRLGPFEKATDGSIRAHSPELGSAKVRDIYAPRDDVLLRLLREKIKSRVLDMNTHEPIAEISVGVFRSWGSMADVRTNNGHYELPITPLDSEDTVVFIDSQGYFPWVGRLYQGTTGVYDLGTVYLEKERTLQGIVRDGETGTPMEGVHLLRDAAQYVDPSIRVYMGNWGQKHRAITNEKGEFLMKKLPRDADRLTLITPSRRGSTIDIPADVEKFDIDLYFNGVIEGLLTLPNGSAVEGEVELRGSSITSWPVQTNNGVFRWEGLNPDTYWLVGESEAGLVKSRTVTLGAGERVTDIELKVQPGWSAEGAITGLKGNESVVITVKDADGRELIRKWFRNGSYAIHGVPNEALITAITSTGLISIRRFDKGNAEGGAIDFYFDNQSQLRGFVLAGGEPVQGMSLSAVPKNLEHAGGSTKTGESGSYVVKGLSDGPHVVRTPTGYSLEIVIDGETTSDIELPENSISGIVRSEQTRMPIGGGVVVVSGLDIPIERGPAIGLETIGSDGTFSFPGLFAGDYEVEVIHRHAEKVTRRVRVEGSEAIELFVQCANTQECNYGGSGPRRTVKTQ